MLQRHTPGRRILIVALCILLVLILSVGSLFLFLTLKEYNPANVESLGIVSTSSKLLKPGDSFSIVTWNTGYSALGDNADFFMDGGTHVQTATRDRVESNLTGIIRTLHDLSPDVLFLQEVDINSSRSYRINTYSRIYTSFPEYDRIFAANYKVPFVPFPIPPIGKVHSGITTLSSYALSYADRIQLPCPFSWPIRLGNLKRCLLICRTPVDGTDKELVMINLHLEAYDDGAGKIAQTEMLHEYMDNEIEKGNYLVVGGDFNQVFSNIDTSAYPASDKWQPGIINTEEFGSEYTFLMDNTTPTCRSLQRPYAGADPSRFQFYMIDGFVVSSNIQVDSIETQDLGFVCSDHNPVLMKATLLP